jgi:RNA polymerase sigma-70 factor (ECF subfamily)
MFSGRAGIALSLPAASASPRLDLAASAPEVSRRGKRAGAAVVEAGFLAADQDFALIERIAKGDKLAMKALFARHEVRVFRFALRLVRREDVAEDIVADTFLDAWRQAPSFERRSSVSTWLMAIARFKALSELRKRGEAPLDEEAAEAIEDEADTPEVIAQKKDKSAVLRTCIDRLSPEHREVIDLVYYHDRSIEEVSRIVGAPENTVKTRMFHARKRLSELARLAGIDRGWP